MSTCGSCCAEQYVEQVNAVITSTTATFSSLGLTASCGPSTPGTISFTGVSPNGATADCFDAEAMARVLPAGAGTVPIGRGRFAIWDDREDSPTRGTVYMVELGRPDHYRRLRIPAGLWYGFCCLSPQPALIANCADLPHDPHDAELRPQDDTRIPYSW